MKNKKRVLILSAVTAALVLGFFGLKKYNESSARAKVVQVAMLSSGYWGDSTNMYGTVYDADTQNVYKEPTQIVSAVYVSQGQEVKKGDRLIAYDMQAQQLTYEIKQLEVESRANELQEAKNDLWYLQNAKPYTEPAPQPEPSEEPEPTAEPVPVLPEEKQIGEAWTVLRRLDQEYIAETEDGYRHYLLSDTGIVCGSFFNALKELEEKTYAVMEVRQGNTIQGELITAWTVCSSYITADYDDDEAWYVLTHDPADGTGSAYAAAVFSAAAGQGTGQYVPQASAGSSAAPASSSANPYDGVYTKEELAQMIIEARQRITEADLSLRRAKLDLKILSDSMSDGVVYAAKDGVVSKVSDPDNPPQDGSAFLSVSSGSGVTIRSSVSELLLDQLKINQPLTVTCFDTGEVFTAYVRSVDVYPSSANIYYGGNTNASYYDFYAYTEEPLNVSGGSYMQLSLDSSSYYDMITLENAFIRSDAGGSYVMKDEDGHLKKQYVKTGKTFYGSVTEIREGITAEDYITFPYGSGSKEGTVTEIAEDMGVFWQ